MPATAGRVKRSHNNRVDGSRALRTHDIWQNAIGHDPYRGRDEDAAPAQSSMSAEEAKKLLRMATAGSGANESRGACERCGVVGHLAIQCRNHIVLAPEEAEKEEDVESDIDSDVVLSSEDEREPGKRRRRDGGDEDRRDRKRMKKERKKLRKKLKKLKKQVKKERRQYAERQAGGGDAA